MSLAHKLAKSPPNYRSATNPEKCCGTCGAFTQEGKAQYGHCSMYDVRVGMHMVCSSWYTDKKK